MSWKGSEDEAEGDSLSSDVIDTIFSQLDMFIHLMIEILRKCWKTLNDNADKLMLTLAKVKAIFLCLSAF